jgi:CCR4-NOT complex subunit CAF16
MSSFNAAGDSNAETLQETDTPMHINVKDLTFGYAGREVCWLHWLRLFMITTKLMILYFLANQPVLRNLNMQLTNGARCLLIGANGAGKLVNTFVWPQIGHHFDENNVIYYLRPFRRSTILRILSGRHLTKPDGAVTVLGRSAFHDTTLNFDRSYLDTDWGMRTVAFAGYGKFFIYVSTT